MKRLYEKGRYNKFHKQNMTKCITVSNALDIDAELDEDDDDEEEEDDDEDDERSFFGKSGSSGSNKVCNNTYIIYINTIHVYYI